MSKVVLLSLLVATMILPHQIARIRSRAAGYKKLKLWMFLCCFVYIMLLIYVYPRVEGS
jgi:NADH:ubiquinone oxidoreductase subunit 6 (subunit J)